MNDELLTDARRRLELAYESNPDDPQVLTQLCAVLEQLDEHPTVLRLHERAIRQWPLDNTWLLSRARLHGILGDFDAAGADYLAVLKRNPAHVEAICSIVALGPGEKAGGLDRVEAHLNHRGLTTSEYYRLSYARAQLLEQDGRYEEAFEVYRSANEQRAAAGGMDLAAKQRGARTVIKDLTAELVDRFSGRGHPSERPVFIVGMPRSGTSLTEQVLAAHSGVYAAGERLFWGNTLRSLISAAHQRDCSMIEAIDSSAPEPWKNAGAAYLQQMEWIDPAFARVTDKLPANFALLPYIRLVFPRARIIHLKRQPLATIMSCIRTPFAEPSLAFTVENWARFHGLYLALMDQWRSLLGTQMLELDYENLVGDFRHQAGRLIEFLGLKWEDACLHPEKAGHVVRTASARQVRSPVHKKSIDAWRRYGNQLGSLEPLIEESRRAVCGQ